MSSELTPAVFSILCHLIEERCGLHYGPSDLPIVADRLRLRASDRGFESLLDYYYFLRYDPEGAAELDQLIEGLVVHETYFFREVEPLRVIVDTIVAPAVAAGQRARIWCAACATGEEPLTLAMLLAERSLLGGVELLASDFSTQALRRAQAGRFSGRSLRAIPAEARARWLKEDDVVFQVDRSLIDAISWRRINLMDTKVIQGIGEFDAIVCRNVLIYFSDTTVARVVETLVNALRPAGVLVVGISESLLRFGTSLRCEERQGAYFYRKP